MSIGLHERCEITLVFCLPSHHFCFLQEIVIQRTCDTGVSQRPDSSRSPIIRVVAVISFYCYTFLRDCFDTKLEDIRSHEHEHERAKHTVSCFLRLCWWQISSFFSAVSRIRRRRKSIVFLVRSFIFIH